MMQIKILGKEGCENCKLLKQRVEKIIKELGYKAEIENITDKNQIMDYGVVALPSLIIGDDIAAIGEIPKYEKLVSKIKKANQGL